MSGRRCTICAHKSVRSINRLIVKGRSLRSIEKQFSDVSDSSVFRHTENCLKLELGAVIQQNLAKQAIDVRAEFEEQLAFAKALREAAKEYLADPLDPLQLSVIPRADEIEVVYYEASGVTVENEETGETTRVGKPIKKSAKLSALLCDVEELRNIDVDKVNIRHVDLRKFALDAINTTDTCIDKFAKLAGLYQQPQANDADLTKVVEAYRLIEDMYPNASDQDRSAWLDNLAKHTRVPVDAIQRQIKIQEIDGVQ